DPVYTRIRFPVRVSVRSRKKPRCVECGSLPSLSSLFLSHRLRPPLPPRGSCQRPLVRPPPSPPRALPEDWRVDVASLLGLLLVFVLVFCLFRCFCADQGSRELLGQDAGDYSTSGPSYLNLWRMT
ncbi:unnamed protein product, partial [Prorocentrum cordatum]